MSSDSKGSARDALIAEMLGDIGRLHDSVGELKVELPEMLRPLREIEAATAEAKRAHQAFLADAASQAKQTIEAVASDQTKIMTIAARATAQGAVKDVAARIEQQLQDGIEKAKATINASTKRIEQAATNYERRLSNSNSDRLGPWALALIMIATSGSTAILIALLLAKGVIPLH